MIPISSKQLHRPNDLLTGLQKEDLVESAIPLRSRLYGLEPIGMGTAHSESLTSYLTRLAEAHCVFAGTLITQEIIPLLNKSYLAGTAGIGPFYDSAGAINSSGIIAADWVRALEALTLRSDLRYLTLLTWNNILVHQKLIRQSQAWCPACFEEQRVGGQLIYEPLLWTLQVVTVCMRHQRKLQMYCPYKDCHRSLHWLGRRALPGYCTFCLRWLGGPIDAAPGEDERLDKEEIARHIWVGENIGELIALAPHLISLQSAKRIEIAVRYYLEQVMKGSLSNFARLLGVSRGLIQQWSRGYTIPTLPNILQLCYKLGISLRTFLSDESGLPDPDPQALRSRQLWVQHLQKPRKPAISSAIRSALEAILAVNQEPPPSFQSVVRQLGYPDATLYRYYPDLCKAISARYLRYQKMKGKRTIGQICEQIREAAYKIHAMGLYPSTSRFAAFGIKPGYFRNREISAVWLEVVHELGWEKGGQRLID